VEHCCNQHCLHHSRLYKIYYYGECSGRISGRGLKEMRADIDY
jgi:hypothetical protein